MDGLEQLFNMSLAASFKTSFLCKTLIRKQIKAIKTYFCVIEFYISASFRLLTSTKVRH